MLKTDFRTDTWKRLEALLRQKLEAVRASNDKQEHDAVKTAGLRGEIRVLKQLLDLPNEGSSDAARDPLSPASWNTAL